MLTLTNGTPYFFKIAATNNGESSAYYPTGTTTVTAMPMSATATPAAPSNLMAMEGDTQVTLSWTAPSDDGGASITDYKVEYAENAGFTPSTKVSSSGTSTSYTVDGLTNGTVYYFRVAATNSAGTGTYSSVGSAVPRIDPNNFSVPKHEDGLRMYPNPTSGRVRVVGLLTTRRYTYKVYSIVGQEVLSGTLGNSAMIDVSELSSSQYVLVLEDEESSEVLRTRLLLLK